MYFLEPRPLVFSIITILSGVHPTLFTVNLNFGWGTLGRTQPHTIAPDRTQLHPDYAQAYSTMRNLAMLHTLSPDLTQPRTISHVPTLLQRFSLQSHHELFFSLGKFLVVYRVAALMQFPDISVMITHYLFIFLT